MRVLAGCRFFQCVRRDGEGEWRMHSLASSHSMLFLSFSLSLSCVLRSIYFLNARRRTIWTEKRKKRILFHRCRSCRGRPTIVLCPVKSMFNRAVSNIQIFKRSEQERIFLFNWLNRKWVKAILQVIVYAYDGMHCNVKCSLPLAIWTDFLLLLLWARDGQG